jgi:AraC-like DNA-binding protein
LLANRYLEWLLRQPLRLVEVRRHVFPAGWLEPPQWVNASRLIFMVDGELPYTIDQTTVRLHTGDALLVPLNSVRSWQVPGGRGARGCTLFWFRYAIDQAAEPPLDAAMRLPQAVTGDELAAMARLHRLYEQPTASGRLTAEAEMKAMLARFLPHARPITQSRHADPAPRPGDMEVVNAVRFLNDQYARRDALTQMYGRIQLSPGHFRKLFRAHMDCSPQDYLTRRRMQAARTRLHETDAAIKRIAHMVGYDDPLYFSKLYARHWGHPPSHDHHRHWRSG